MFYLVKSKVHFFWSKSSDFASFYVIELVLNCIGFFFCWVSLGPIFLEVVRCSGGRSDHPAEIWENDPQQRTGASHRTFDVLMSWFFFVLFDVSLQALVSCLWKLRKIGSNSVQETALSLYKSGRSIAAEVTFWSSMPVIIPQEGAVCCPNL